MSKAKKKSADKMSLQQCFAELKKVQSIDDLQALPSLILLETKNEYLSHKSLESFKSHWKKLEAEVQVLEGSETKPDRLRDMTEQSDLFAQACLTVVRRVEKQKKLLKFLEGVKDLPAATSLCIEVVGKATAALKKNVKDNGGLTISFSDLSSDDHLFMVKAMTKRLQLKFSDEAFDYILNAMGNDLFEVENELSKLAYIFAGREEALNIAELEPYMHYLKQDHIFTLTNYLLGKKQSQALLLIQKLLGSGEGGPAILGVLARHCRQTVRMKSLLQQGVTGWDLARQLRLPIHVVKSYTNYARTSDSSLREALDLCREIDKASKLKSFNWELALMRVVHSIC